MTESGDVFPGLVGESNAIQEVRGMMGQVANTEVSVLITGESGTGKGLLLELHINSNRQKNHLFHNCGAIPNELWKVNCLGMKKAHSLVLFQHALAVLNLLMGVLYFLMKSEICLKHAG